MRRAPHTLVLAGALLALTTATTAQAAHRAVVPVRGATACKTRPPVLLSAGRSPHAPLRLRLAGMAGHSVTLVDIESADAKTHLANGSLSPNSTTDTVKGVIRGGRLAHGRVSLAATFHLSGSAYPKAHTVTLSGYVDSLGGGLIEGKPNTDHFPREAVGIGATWRVVNCDAINQTPAKETRTYTLRSVTGGVASMTYQDVVTIDPAHLDLGSQKVGSEVVHFELMTLRGTATGSTTIPFARGFAQASHTVTRMQVTFHAVSKSSVDSVIRTDIVDTDTAVPSR